jgi:peptidoglycan/xylan/chitin deacetylase (PgdA/CDA1 family)
MRKQAQNLAARIKKTLVAMIVLLIFLFPGIVTAKWVKEVLVGNETRKVYSQSEIQAFSDTNCTVNAEGVRPFDEPLITITFDDGWETIYSNGLPALEKYCIESTQYILGNHFDDPLYLSADQTRSLQRAGHEVASHTMTHPNLTQFNPDQLEWELGESSRQLTEFGTIRDFASPLGASNPQTLAAIKKYYRSHRNTVGDPTNGVADVDINVRATFNPYQINAYTVRDSTTIEELQAMIDYTIEHKGWLVLTYHQVDNSGAHYGVTKSVLQEHLKLVHDSRVRTPTMGQVLDAWEAKGKGN